MDFALHRIRTDSTGVYGFLSDNEEAKFTTLEHNFESGPVIPPGIYSCVRRASPHFGCDLFMLVNVPGHDFVEIHKGNTQADSKGCILLGSSFGEDCIVKSKEAFDQFMAIQEGVNQFILTVT